MSVPAASGGARLRLFAVLRVLTSFIAAVLAVAAVMWPVVSARGPERLLLGAIVLALPSLLLATTLAAVLRRSDQSCLVAMSLVAPFAAAVAYGAFTLTFDFEGRGSDLIEYFVLTGSLPAAVLGMFFASTTAAICYVWERRRVRRTARRRAASAGEKSAS